MAGCRQYDRSEVKVDRCAYRWEICNFSDIIPGLHEVILSPVFHMGKDDVKWRLGCEIEDTGEVWICLDLGFAGNGQPPVDEQSDFKVQYEITIYNKLHTILEKLPEQIHDFTTSPRDEVMVNVTRATLINLLHPYDSLIVECKIVRPREIQTYEVSSPMKRTEQTHQFTEDFRRLLNEPNQFTDFTIVVGDKKFPVHKLILASRCPYFAKMFTHDFAENREHKVNINGSEPEIIEAVLEYIYTNQVTNLPQVAGRLITVAHEYELDFLQTMCEEAICEALDPKNACDAMILAEKIGSQKFIQFVRTFIADHLPKVIKNTGTEIDDLKRLQHVMQLIDKSK